MMISGGVRERSSGSAVPAGAAGVAEEKAPSAEEAQLPFAGYDRLSERELKEGLSAHSQIELEAVEGYERAHKRREAVLNKLRYLRGTEPLPGHKREAVAAVVRVTRQRVVSFASSHDRDTDVATEIFTLEPSLRQGAPALAARRSGADFRRLPPRVV